MNVVDSSAWLEYLAQGQQADIFADVIENVRELIVPSIVIFEVRKRLLVQKKFEMIPFAVQLLRLGKEVPIDNRIALAASETSVTFKLPLADSLIYCITQLNNATLWTMDSHFEGLPNVKYFAKK